MSEVIKPIEIIKGRIHWSENFNNPPSLELLVTRVPAISEYVYEQRNDCYYSEIDGICSFFSYTGPDRGFGGRGFTLKMKDGNTKELVGPWSSGATSMNAMGFGPCVETSIISEPDGYAKGYTFYAAAVTMEMLGRFRDRIAVTPYRISTAGSPWKGFDKMIRFPRGSRFTMLELGDRNHKPYSNQPSDEQRLLGSVGHDKGPRRFIPIVELPDGTYWVKPATFSVPIVPPDGSEVVDIPPVMQHGVWTGDV